MDASRRSCVSRRASLIGMSSVIGGSSLGRAVDYDAYSERYDELDGGPLASWLRIPAMRMSLVQQAIGDVLEVAAGTGLNAAYYSRDVKSLTLLDSSSGMIKRAAVRAPDAKFVIGDALALPFETATFDTVVSTFSLCVLDRPVKALLEMRRVLKPGGRVLLLENTRPDNWVLGAYVDATAAFIADNGGKGCRYDVDVPKLVDEAGLRVDSASSYFAGFFKAFVLYVADDMS